MPIFFRPMVNIIWQRGVVFEIYSYIEKYLILNVGRVLQMFIRKLLKRAELPQFPFKSFHFSSRVLYWAVV